MHRNLQIINSWQSEALSAAESGEWKRSILTLGSQILSTNLAICGIQHEAEQNSSYTYIIQLLYQISKCVSISRIKSVLCQYLKIIQLMRNLWCVSLTRT